MKKGRLTKTEKLKESLLFFTLANATYQIELLSKSIQYHKNELEALVYEEPLHIFFFKHKNWKRRLENEKEFLGELIDLYNSQNKRFNDMGEELGGYYEHKN